MRIWQDDHQTWIVLMFKQDLPIEVVNNICRRPVRRICIMMPGLKGLTTLFMQPTFCGVLWLILMVFTVLISAGFK